MTKFFLIPLYIFQFYGVFINKILQGCNNCLLIKAFKILKWHM
jgi:hypothetical protein